MKKTLITKVNIPRIFLLYLTLFIPVLVLIASAWYFLVDGNFYYCSDKVPFVDLLPPFVHGKNFGDYFVAPPIIVYVLWIAALVSIVALPWVIMKRVTKKKTSTIKIVLVSLLIPVLLFVGMFTYGLANSTSLPPAPPPNWDSPSTVYTIKKEHENYLIHYVIEEEEGDYFIGNSKIDLANFIDKKVIIKGNFPKNFSDMMSNISNTQCIQDICHKIFNPKFWEEQNQNTSVVNIDNVQEILESKPRDRVIEYVVVNGDTIMGIAEKFSVSTNTIKWANNLNSDSIRLGQALKILPVTGVMHTVSKNETIYTIAQKYRVDVKKIIDFPYNTFNDDIYSLTTDQTIIIPDGVKP